MKTVTNLYIGSPGSGKTTVAAKLAKKALKKGIPVYSNVAIKGTYKLDPKKDIGYYEIYGALVLIDEIGIVYNNRNWKTNINDIQMEWIKTFRHNKCCICCFSQGLDFDNRFLGVSENVYLVRKSIFNLIGIPLTKTQRIIRKCGIDEISKQLIDQYELVKFSLQYTFRPFYYKLFDSFEHRTLPGKDWEKW